VRGLRPATRDQRPPAAVEPRFFYGWVVVAATFVTLFFGFGVAYSFPAFFVPLRDEFDASRGEVSLVFAITGFLYFSLGALSGILADRIGVRRVVMFGVLCMGFGLLLAGFAQELWQVYLTYSLGVGLGVGFAYVPAVGTVQRWFLVRRGFASGMAVTGVGLGTLIVPLAAVGLIRLVDWRATYAILGSLVLVAGLAASRLLEDSPARRGLLPDGIRRSEGMGAAPPLAGETLRQALHSRLFWLLYGASVATSVGLFIPFAHMAPYARDHGLAAGTGAFLVGVIGIGSTTGRFLLGGSADRIGRRRSLGATFAGMGLMLLWWLAATELWSLILFAFFFGMAYGGYVALAPALTADYFGPRHAGSIIGVLYTAAAGGALAGPVLAGVIYDVRESYTLPILFGVAANVVAVACIVFMPEPRRR
jgi:MFS family permease